MNAVEIKSSNNCFKINYFYKSYQYRFLLFMYTGFSS